MKAWRNPQPSISPSILVVVNGLKFCHSTLPQSLFRGTGCRNQYSLQLGDFKCLVVSQLSTGLSLCCLYVWLRLWLCLCMSVLSACLPTYHPSPCVSVCLSVCVYFCLFFIQIPTVSVRFCISVCPPTTRPPVSLCLCDCLCVVYMLSVVAHPHTIWICVYLFICLSVCLSVSPRPPPVHLGPHPVPRK